MHFSVCWKSQPFRHFRSLTGYSQDVLNHASTFRRFTSMLRRAFALAIAFGFTSSVAALYAQTLPPVSVTDTTKRVGVASTPASSSAEHPSAAPQAMATRLTGTVQVDGRLDESIWQSAAPITQLYQVRPTEGAPPSQRTEIRVVYDDEAIYVGARMFDDKPSSIVARLARRDADTGSDYILIQFDPYHNHNGDASFMLNPEIGRASCRERVYSK